MHIKIVVFAGKLEENIGGWAELGYLYEFACLNVVRKEYSKEKIDGFIPKFST